MSDKNRGLSPVIRKSILAATAIIILMAQNIPNANSGEDRTYETERLLLAKKIKNILISSGVCGSIKDCTAHQFLFVSPAKEGIAIATYGVSDHAVLRRISEEAIAVFYTTDRVSIEIEHFAFTKGEELKSFFKTGKPFVTIKMER